MSVYDMFSERRKAGQARKTVPDWMVTAGYQLLYNKNYLDVDETPKDRFNTIAAVLSQPKYSILPITHERVFDLLWNGVLSLPTPALTSIGKSNRGMPVSCTGNYIPDSIDGFFSAAKEIAQLTKEGFGTSSDLSDIRPRGAQVSNGLKATGVLPVVELINKTTNMVSQGKNRAGAWAGYITFEHGDFYEYCKHIEHNPKENVGFIRTAEFLQMVRNNDADAHNRLKTWAKLRCEKGTGYLIKRDAIERRWAAQGRPARFRASNLCNEIHLPSDESMSYTCVLSSLNLAKYDEWRDHPTALTDAFIVLNAINELFIDLAEQKGWGNDRELSRTLKFAKKYRALGMGVMGYHTYLQSKSIPFHAQQAVNHEIFHRIQQAGQQVSRALAQHTGKVAYADQYNWAMCAIAPTLSTSLIMGGVSGGIEPVFSNVYSQEMAGGIVPRVNPVLLDLMKRKGIYSKSLAEDINAHNGSVQHLSVFTNHEKSVFKTGFEIDQMQIIRHAGERQQYIDQGQSVNLFNCGDQAYQSRVHSYAFSNDNLLGLYYLRPSERQMPEPACDACDG
jgi:ribonucleoside-diphosphate reductase alpha chain